MSSSGLFIRKNVRHEISMPARVRVGYPHAEVVKFSNGVGGDDGWIDVHLIDFSYNGIGIVSEIFLPRGVLVEIEVLDQCESEQKILVNCQMRVMRVQMTDRRPAYLIGGAFAELNDEIETQIHNLMQRLDGNGDDHA